jgi:endoglucanase
MPLAQPALDLSSPMLTLTAIHVTYDSDDPYFTILQPGEYAKVKPTGHPCDPAFNCYPPQLSEAGTIALITVISLVGVIIISLGCWYMILLWSSA